MAKITFDVGIFDYQPKELKFTFGVTRWDSSKYNQDQKVFDSDNATSEYTLDLVYQNVQDSKILTILKTRNEEVDKYLKNARLKNIKGDKKGGIDEFQLRVKIDGKAKSLILINPSVIYTNDVLVGVAKDPIFVFTLRTTEKIKPVGAGNLK
jgi:hypothetical protein